MIVAKGKGPRARKKKGETKMTWEIVLALVLAIPVILLPAAYVGYLTIGGVAAVRGERKERAGAAGHAVAG